MVGKKKCDLLSSSLYGVYNLWEVERNVEEAVNLCDDAVGAWKDKLPSITNMQEKDRRDNWVNITQFQQNKKKNHTERISKRSTILQSRCSPPDPLIQQAHWTYHAQKG